MVNSRTKKCIHILVQASREAVAIHHVHAQVVAACSSFGPQDVLYISGDHGHESLYPCQTTITYLRYSKKGIKRMNSWKNILKTRKLSKKLKALISEGDVIVADGLRVSALISPLVKKGQYIFTIVHGEFVSLEAFNSVQIAAMKSSNFHYIGVSKTVANSLIGVGFFGRQVHSVINGIDIVNIKNNMLTKEVARNQLGFTKNDYVIGSLGRLEHEKQYDQLIVQFSVYAKGDADARLLIVGGGSKYHELNKLVESLSIEDKVVLTGYKDEGSKYLNAMDVFSMCSKTEGFALAPVEALIAGLPLILNNIDAFCELEEYAGSERVRICKDSSDFVSMFEYFKNNELPMSLDMTRFGHESMREAYYALIAKEALCRNIKSEYQGMV
ncbi:glycosyltransferase [Oceanicoccus sagamiensis]|uniref:Glycosyl transferase family 1 domain-containing protein n=1 Tax=Oceanicoccus sagamiensis TaxID=716816 RepID=A0A1X9N878_9GAMM|nr:glycosyltransferase [Oceanicoccus sagamiensis]ARN72642.1 hypothetical protein BST96_00045 [Oceanicoccus sagamiensis]